MRARQYVLLLMAAAPAVMPAAAVGQCSYSAEVITAPECPWPFEYTPFIDHVSGNDNGLVTGYFSNCGGSVPEDISFTWNSLDGLVVIPNPPGGDALRAYDISNEGTIVGQWSTITSSYGIGFKIDQRGFSIVAPAPYSPLGAATNVNNSGQIVGYWIDTPNITSDFAYQGFLFSDGGYQIIDPTYGTHLQAFAVNDLGAVTGWMGNNSTSDNHVFLYKDGVVTDLGVPDGAVGASGRGINNANRIVGSSLSFGKESILPRGFEWTAEDGFRFLPPIPGYETSSALAVNDDHTVVGFSSPTVFSFAHYAARWQNGVAVDLNDLVEFDGTFELKSARSINANGQIAALGTYNGHSAGFWLTPLPPNPADLSGDCHVDGLDLMILLESWGPLPPSPPASGGGRGAGSEGGKRNATPAADLDGDGVVNGFDLALLLGAWG